MTATVRAAIAAFGIAAGIVTAAGPNTSAAPTAPTLASATNTNAARVSNVRLAGFDQVLADDDSCNGGSLQGSYYCYQQGGTQSQTTQDEYTPAQPPFGYNNLPQCSAGSSAIAGALSGDGCS
ncbi:MAG: hypothetical protein QOJ50_2114 [Cryptosporangiaceae bacterium]|jgi:hypothetical protein|nr:hypothetical protein [Cryptosporangiaceae bacterium]